uniref:Putative homeodomain-like protein n=1 Tax=Tanacetum cinerariifolium TaxID=118510 RepID=A0A6L2LF26_TANCI|nr:putative homeodomain-like protein [Tanacetum cinerariifolium]
MAKALSANKNVFKKGTWSEEEDHKLRAYIQIYGHWNWGLLPKFAGLSRNGKSCRLRWVNYLRPHVKHGNFTLEEDNIILDMHNKLGNKWPPRVTFGRLLPHARGLGFKPRRGGFPSEAKKEWGLSPKAKVRVLHTTQLNVTVSSNH